MNIRGPRFTRAQRTEGLRYAREWRVRMKPHFDALYGPELKAGRCEACGQTTLVAA